ncbi:hypothetical protein HDU76_009474 [Blyttiomyces sp. JEL0837]|nr:hypothetical protein HDU76_009474 [Blyttiomyces sp. JEL0837]
MTMRRATMSSPGLFPSSLDEVSGVSSVMNVIGMPLNGLSTSTTQYGSLDRGFVSSDWRDDVWNVNGNGLDSMDTMTGFVSSGSMTNQPNGAEVSPPPAMTMTMSGSGSASNGLNGNSNVNRNSLPPLVHKSSVVARTKSFMDGTVGMHQDIRTSQPTSGTSNSNPSCSTPNHKRRPSSPLSMESSSNGSYTPTSQHTIITDLHVSNNKSSNSATVNNGSTSGNTGSLPPSPTGHGPSSLNDVGTKTLSVSGSPGRAASLMFANAVKDGGSNSATTAAAGTNSPPDIFSMLATHVVEGKSGLRSLLSGVNANVNVNGFAGNVESNDGVDTTGEQLARIERVDSGLDDIIGIEEKDMVKSVQSNLTTLLKAEHVNEIGLDHEISNNSSINQSKSLQSQQQQQQNRFSIAQNLPAELLFTILSHFDPQPDEAATLLSPAATTAPIAECALVNRWWNRVATVTLWKRPWVHDLSRLEKMVNAAELSSPSSSSVSSSENDGSDNPSALVKKTAPATHNYPTLICHLSLSTTLSESHRYSTRLSTLLTRSLQLPNINLTTLDLGFCKGVTNFALQRAAHALSNLSSLNLAGGGRSEICVIKVARECGSRLRRLGLGWNFGLGDFCVREVARLCWKLEWLDVSGCSKITDSGCFGIAKGLTSGGSSGGGNGTVVSSPTGERIVSVVGSPVSVTAVSMGLSQQQQHQQQRVLDLLGSSPNLGVSITPELAGSPSESALDRFGSIVSSTNPLQRQHDVSSPIPIPVSSTSGSTRPVTPPDAATGTAATAVGSVILRPVTPCPLTPTPPCSPAATPTPVPMGATPRPLSIVVTESLMGSTGAPSSVVNTPVRSLGTLLTTQVKPVQVQPQSSLRYLGLNHCSLVTDAGVKEIVERCGGSLEVLNVVGTEVKGVGWIFDGGDASGVSLKGKVKVWVKGGGRSGKGGEGVNVGGRVKEVMVNKEFVPFW